MRQEAGKTTCRISQRHSGLAKAEENAHILRTSLSAVYASALEHHYSANPFCIQIFIVFLHTFTVHLVYVYGLDGLTTSCNIIRFIGLEI